MKLAWSIHMHNQVFKAWLDAIENSIEDIPFTVWIDRVSDYV